MSADISKTSVSQPGVSDLQPSLLSLSDLQQYAQYLDIKYAVLDNLSCGRAVFKASLTLTNTGPLPLTYGSWEVFFNHSSMIEPDVMPEQKSIDLHVHGVRFTHVNGWLFKMAPMESFKTLKQYESMEIFFTGEHYSIARTDSFPNWYIAVAGLPPQVIASTVGEGLDFVAAYDSPQKWKRFDYYLSNGQRRYDCHDPWTPEKRFEENRLDSEVDLGLMVTPSPLDWTVVVDQPVFLFKVEEWAVVVVDEIFQLEANFLISFINVQPCNSSSDKKVIKLLSGDMEHVTSPHGLCNNESYMLSVSPDSIVIMATGRPGMFYGVQTLVSLMSNENLQSCSIRDCPRYPYRGMHLDVSRNFHQKEEVKRLIDVMAMYKMNKLHLHLTDDEGWRLEIAGLDELTTVGFVDRTVAVVHWHGDRQVGRLMTPSVVGGVRGHDMSEESCLLPFLGSGPHSTTSGSGYYTADDYREILRHATDRHIEVIPEIDMPGHCHAAIMAMQSRYKRLKADNHMEEAEKYLLSDPQETTLCKSRSVQMFTSSSLNPGLESTFTFIDAVISALVDLHRDICPLRTFHAGADEVPAHVWSLSPACKALVASGVVQHEDNLMEYFMKRVSGIVAMHGLNLATWQDGMISEESKPFSRDLFTNDHVQVYAWQPKLASCAYELANNDFEIVMSYGTHLYFDHAYEPDPEERGLYWATRYINTRKTFDFQPDNLYSNIDKSAVEENPQKLTKRENIIGMQGQLWSELIRRPEQLQCMIFPRLVALAERAWHKASWETDTDGSLKQNTDWARFSRCLGIKELKRLDAVGISYHLPPPGAKFASDRRLHCNVTYQGLPVQYSIDEKTWHDYSGPVNVDAEHIALRTRSADGKRSSRIVHLYRTAVSADD